MSTQGILHIESLLYLFLALFLIKDPLLRRAGMFTIATAYCGTGDNAAIRRLLHVAVSIYAPLYNACVHVHAYVYI